jgi:mitogen-activated protein kinase 1/3
MMGMTEYVATRWYRAPEVMIASRKYDKAMDVWSAGCVLAELISPSSPRVLFPGKHYTEMVSLMVNLLGTPTPNDLSYVTNPKVSK